MAEPKNEYLPLTQMQRGIFVDSSAAAGDDPYIMQVMVEPATALDHERLSRAIDAVVGSHPAMRACFRIRTSGEPVQIVVPAAHVPSAHDDLRDVAPELLTERLEEIRRVDAATAFDLGVAPLMRFRLADLPGGRQQLLFSAHHIVLDGWSVSSLLRDVLAVYGGAEPVAEYVFRDYLAWESQADARAADEAFARVLEGLASPSMVAEHVAGAESGERTIAANLPAAATAALADWCRRRETSLASVVEVCWAQAVALQTGRTDVVVGVMEANRSLGTPGIATAVGLFANVVPVRVDLREGATVAALCEQLGRQRLETLPHRHLGLGRIQAGNGGAPLFDTIVTFQNYRSTGTVDADDARAVRILASRSRTPTTQPALLAVVPGESLHVELTHRMEAVTSHRAQAMLDVFAHLLASVPAHADTVIREWPLTPSATPAGEARRSPARDRTPLVPEQLREAARRHRDRTAVSTVDGGTSYRELFTESAALANWLAETHDIGVGSAVAVAVADERQALSVRLAAILAGATVHAVTAAELESALVLADRAGAPLRNGQRIVLVDDPAVLDAVRRRRGLPLRAVAVADSDEALGVPGDRRAVTHRALAKAVAGYAERIGVSHHETLLTASTASVSVLAALVRGAHVVLAENATGDALVSAARLHAVTVVEGSASALAYVARVDPDLLRGRRAVVSNPPLTCSAADAIRRAEAELWLSYAPGGELVSLTPVRDDRCVPAIGATLSGVALQILDPYGRISPDGSLGEIAVVDDLGVRRTGDLGRRTATGATDYLGPISRRLEIRGNRIEPWVVEEALVALSGVSEAVVHRVDDAHSQVLVAHLAPATVDSDAVTEALRGRLPSYAVPSRIATWPLLPRTPDGAVDLSRLTGRLSEAEVASESVAQLAQLFAEITGADDVGPHSDFFAIGGDSIGVTRLRAHAASRHGWDLDLRHILELRTPAAIARELADDRDPSSAVAPDVSADRLPRRAAETGREGGLIGTQASLWLLNRLDAESSRYNLTFALDLLGDLDESALVAAVDDVAERHEVLRTSYALREGAPVQCVKPLRSGRPLLRIVDTPTETLDAGLAASADRGFRLDAELPMRAELHRVAPGEATLLFTFHHVAIDGASFLPFARDLELAYDARRRGEAPRFATAPVQYLDYVAWLDRRLGDVDEPGTRAAQQAAYWRGHLEGLGASTGMPVQAPPQDDRRGDHARRLLLTWGPEVLDAAGRIARQAGTTRFAAYQTALAAALHSLGAATDLALGVPVSGRPHVDLEDALGYYSNVVVSRVRLDPEEGLSGNTARRGRALAGELDHQDLPFNEVVRAVHAPRQPGRNPLFQTALVLQSYDKPEIRLCGVAVTERLMPVVDARNDLVVAIVERAQGEGVAVAVEFAEAVYPAHTVELLAERFRRLLIEGAADPDLPVSLHLSGLGSTAEVAPRATVASAVGTPAASDAVGGDPLLAEVLAAYGTAIRFGEIEPDAGYFDAGGDSVGTVSVAAALARHDVDIATLMTGPSARELAARIADGEFRDASAPSDAGFAGVAAAGYDVDLLDPFSPILPIRPAGAKRPLFAFHGGVGLSIPYTGLSRAIDPAVPIYGLQSTEAIFGAAPPESMTEQVRSYLGRIREVQPQGPYRLLGWSYGGWAAHEAARLLEDEGDEVELLVIVDSEVPNDPERTWGPKLPREAVVRAFTMVLGISGEDGSDITTAEQLHAAFQRSAGAFAQLTPEEVERFIDTMQRHAHLAARHRPGAVEAPTVLLWSSSVGTRHPSELTDEWAPFLAGPVSSVGLEAQHQFMMHPLPQRLIGTVVNALLEDPGRTQLLTEPRYREELEFLDYLAAVPEANEEAPPAAAAPIAEPVGIPSPSTTRGPVAGLLIETGTLVWRRLHHLRKAPWRLISVVLNPLILIVALGYLFAGAIVFPGYDGVYMNYLLAGVCAQAALQNIGPTAIAIRADLDKGLFDRFRSLPMRRSVVLFAHSIADSMIGVVGMLIVVFAGFLAGWRLGTGLAGFAFGLLVLVVFTYVCVWVGIGVGLFVKNLESIESIAVSLSVGLSFLSNALLAPNTLPQWLQPFAEWNPVSAVATSVRQAWGNPVAKSASIAGDIPLLVAGIFFALVLVVVPVVSQRRYRKTH